VLAEYAAGMPRQRPENVNEALQRELMELAEEVLGEAVVRQWGGWWARRAWWKPGKVRRVLLAVREDLQPSSTVVVRNTGRHGCDLWYRFAD
jgi:hypothetical protein